ncbi:MAG: bifunctional UDP-N-acetylmuramoyl-tripeptide:D-alanyl-D-alanine ligase/alanine racemase [Bacteroidales bacterium]|nr:bifunctional UDP-N-acetylmuramoyl-tripeptide:D-alanyl-D-alanine ligase/alanine racemase [Bacteroidales bacterium]
MQKISNGMLTIAQIKDICQAKDCHLADGHAEIELLAFDSRNVLIPQKTLFFAITTAKNDGHHYIAELWQQGVKNFVITRPVSEFSHFSDANFLQVNNAVTALQQIAAYHRQQFSYPVVGITGSNGKTIVKEWLSQMLAPEFHVVRNPNSYNSQIGVPLSVWQMAPRHNLAIFEAGISQPGEMERLAAVIQPTIGILTNIGAAHNEFFHNNEEKLIEKTKLFKDCQKVIYCSDNPLIHNYFKQDERFKGKTISWGRTEDADYHIDFVNTTDVHTVVSLNGQLIDIPFSDAGSIENALHSIVLMLQLNFTLPQINQKLHNLSAVSMRMEMIEGINNSVIINDTYSLDMSSLRIALDFLNAQTQMIRKTVIISDFEQAGNFDTEDYQKIYKLLINKGITRLIAVGAGFYAHRTVFDFPEQSFYHNTDELLANLNQEPFHQEVILVKAARSYRFEKVVAALQYKTHQTVLNVNLPAIIHNLSYYRSLLKPETKMVAMVKAQSYGLGDVELINELIYHHVNYHAVAYTDEGIRLRKRNITKPIIVLGAEAHSFEAMIAYRLEPEIFNFHYLEQLTELLEQHSDIELFKIHIKLDTGMHRLGFDEGDLPRLVEFIQRHPKLKVASIFSHLAAAEDPDEDDFTRGQIALFDRMSSYLIGQFDYPILRHILNSAGISRFPEAQYDMVRLGIGLYGFSAVPQDQAHLQNTVTLRTVITQVKTIPANETIGYNRSYKTLKESKIAIIPIGYADGYPRELGNGVGKVFVAGRLVPIVGKICMDMCMIDVTGLEVKEGDEVIVYGDPNPLDKVAASIHRIPYELMTAISKRVQRIYIKE